VDNTVRKITSIPPQELPRARRVFKWYRCALGFIVAWVLWWYVIARLAFR